MSIYVGSSINKGIGGGGGSVVTTAKTWSLTYDSEFLIKAITEV